MIWVSKGTVLLCISTKGTLYKNKSEKNDKKKVSNHFEFVIPLRVPVEILRIKQNLEENINLCKIRDRTLFLINVQYQFNSGHT